MSCNFNFYHVILLILSVCFSTLIVYRIRKKFNNKNILLVILLSVLIFSLFYKFNNKENFKNWELHPNNYDQLDPTLSENNNELDNIQENNDVITDKSLGITKENSNFTVQEFPIQHFQAKEPRPNINITYNIKYIKEKVEPNNYNRLENKITNLKNQINRKNVLRSCNLNYTKKTCPITIGNYADYESLNEFANIQKQDLMKPSSLLYNPFIGRGGNNPN